MTKTEKLARALHEHCARTGQACLIAVAKDKSADIGVCGKVAELAELIRLGIEHTAQGDKGTALALVAGLGAHIAKGENDFKAFEKIRDFLDEV